MIKTTLIHILIILGMGFVMFNIQRLALPDFQFNLRNVYIFHALATIVVYVTLKFLSKSPKLKDQIGFLYLGTIFLKTAIFIGLFKDTVMSDNSMTNFEGLSLLFPLFIFLFLEVYFIAKILNKMEQKT